MINYTIIKNGNTLTMSLSEDTSMALDSEKNCTIEREIKCDVLTLVAAMGKSVIVETYKGIEVKRLSLKIEVGRIDPNPCVDTSCLNR